MVLNIDQHLKRLNNETWLCLRVAFEIYAADLPIYGSANYSVLFRGVKAFMLIADTRKMIKKTLLSLLTGTL